MEKALEKRLGCYAAAADQPGLRRPPAAAAAGRAGAFYSNVTRYSTSGPQPWFRSAAVHRRRASQPPRLERAAAAYPRGCPGMPEPRRHVRARSVDAPPARPAVRRGICRRSAACLERIRKTPAHLCGGFACIAFGQPSAAWQREAVRRARRTRVFACAPLQRFRRRRPPSARYAVSNRGRGAWRKKNANARVPGASVRGARGSCAHGVHCFARR